MDRRWWGLVAASVGIVAAVAARAEFAAPWWWVLKNLALAWIPVVVGAAATRSRASFWLLAPLWLVFLPNAPYLLSDLVHLAPRRVVPFWYDACLLGGLGALGLALGARSLSQVTAAVAGWYGARTAEVLQWTVPPVCGFAMVLGRELRFNSWDLAQEPLVVLRASAAIVLRPHHHAELLAMAVVFGAVFGAAVLATADRPAACSTPSS